MYSLFRGNIEGGDQTVRMRRLICVVVRMRQNQCFLERASNDKLYVFSSEMCIEVQFEVKYSP